MSRMRGPPREMTATGHGTLHSWPTVIIRRDTAVRTSPRPRSQRANEEARLLAEAGLLVGSLDRDYLPGPRGRWVPKPPGPPPPGPPPPGPPPGPPPPGRPK